MAIVALVIGGLALIGLLTLLAAGITAVVIGALWGWFITPLFGVPVPWWPGLIGLSLIVGWFTGSSETTKNHEPDFRKATTVFLARPVFVLLFGWIVARYMGTA